MATKTRVQLTILLLVVLGAIFLVFGGVIGTVELWILLAVLIGGLCLIWRRRGSRA
jgi:Na+-translocating ferredoxin:NAD+ oxidoreductase RnfD subunit